MSKIFWFQNLSGGMDQASDTALVNNNDSPLLVNVSLDQVGNWASRKGTSKLGATTSGSERVWGLGHYIKSNNTFQFFRVANQDLELFDGSNSWDIVDTDQFTADRKVNFENHVDKLFCGCEFQTGDTPNYLGYTTGSTVTLITPNIVGHIMGTNKSVLAVGGNNLKPNVIFFTDPFTDQFYRNFTGGTATATCAADADSGGANTVTITTDIFPEDIPGTILYNYTDKAMNLVVDYTDVNTVTTDAATSTWDNDTIYMLRNKFTQDERVTGIVGFQENFVSFDNESMYIWDPFSNWSQKLPGFGCVNERTIQIVDGNLIWADREGVYLYNGKERPVDITGKILDNVDGYGVWNLIQESSWVNLAAGTSEGKYYLSIGTLSTLSGAPASALANAELVFDTKKSTWTLNSRDDQPTCYSKFIGRDDSSDNEDLYFGETTNIAVYRMNTGTTDADSAGSSSTISVDARTPHFVFDKPTSEWRLTGLYVKYKSGGTVTVTLSCDRGSYATFASLSSSSTVTVVRKMPRTEFQGHTMSAKFTTTSTATIEAVGFEVEEIGFSKISG